jgi:hypothetical protein
LNLRHLVEKRQSLEDLFLQTHDERPQHERTSMQSPWSTAIRTSEGDGVS